MQIFHINTRNTSLILAALPSGLLSCLHYGARLRLRQEYSALLEKKDVCYGDMVAYSREDAALGLDDVCLAFSTPGRGDFREPMAEILLPDGSSTTDFTFVSHELLSGKPPLAGLPSSYCDGGNCETHRFTLEDSAARLRIRLFYTAFYESDVIACHAEYENLGAEPVSLVRAMSAQLDLPDAAFDFITFTGAWANERQRQDKPLSTGVYVNDSKQGASSSRANPFVMLKRRGADEHQGECYAFNLVYSGNHAEIVEATHFGKTRLLLGINPFAFRWLLAPGKIFTAPEAVMAFSAEGLGGVSRCMHRFVRHNIVRGVWKERERPVLINSWEGTGMDFDERKLLSIAKVGAELGAELFVMDDGWFGTRNDDTQALGDWVVNPKKLPHGLDGLQKRLRALGLDFGIWVEPEMVSENSALFRAHPDWAVRQPGRTPCLGRNQLVLDLCRKEVREYLVDAMTRVFSAAEISYVKWDNNRNFSDAYSPVLPPERQGEFFHRYMLGLYAVLSELTARFPNILFESCASGGNRFDLGMLCYMPQTWTSDNTDPMCRLTIQDGTSYGYPLSTLGAHVSASPHQSTLRQTPVETRFNVASFGLLGYEMDLTELTPFDRKCIAAQVAYYKAHRRLFQFGTFYRVRTPEHDNRPVWLVVSEDRREAIACLFQFRAEPAHTQDILRLTGLNDALLYEIEGRAQYLSLRAFGSLVKHALPVKLNGEGAPMAMLAARYRFPMPEEQYLAGGDILQKSGLRLRQQFGGTGYNDRLRILGDNGSRMYYLHAVEDSAAK